MDRCLTGTGAGPGWPPRRPPARCAFLARVGREPVGICLIGVCPASLTLGEFWMVRDVFVEPRWRRAGVAIGLLDAVCAVAQRHRALRLTLQTEDDNTEALRLYEHFGFRPVTGLRYLTPDLAPTDHEPA